MCRWDVGRDSSELYAVSLLYLFYFAHFYIKHFVVSLKERKFIDYVVGSSFNNLSEIKRRKYTALTASQS